jgi:hypothetical protein
LGRARDGRELYRNRDQSVVVVMKGKLVKKEGGKKEK